MWTFWRRGKFFTAAWNRTTIVLSCHIAGGTDENNDESRASLSAGWDMKLTTWDEAEGLPAVFSLRQHTKGCGAQPDLIPEFKAAGSWTWPLTCICTYRGADKSLARPTFRCILFDGENISFDASLVIYINSTNISPIMIINRIYGDAVIGGVKNTTNQEVECLLKRQHVSAFALSHHQVSIVSWRRLYSVAIYMLLFYIARKLPTFLEVFSNLSFIFVFPRKLFYNDFCHWHKFKMTHAGWNM
jgi:hypothetical protein